MTSKIILNVKFNDYELNALALADELLHRIQNQLAETQSTQSIDNGDVVNWHDIARARGVIDHYFRDTQFLVR